MKMKRILAIVLSVIMLVGSMATVSAEGTTVEVFSNDTLISALTAGSDVKITESFTVNDKVTVPDGATIDLNGKTLNWNVENSYFGTSTVKNGNIVLGKDDVAVCDGYFLINEGKTLTLDGVNITSSADGMKCYCVFHLKTGAAVDVKNSTINVAKNEYAPGYVVYANEATAKADFTNSAVTTEDVAGVVHAATTITSSSFIVKGTEGTEMEHGINRSAVTITDSEVSISGGTGRGITPTHGPLVIEGNSTVEIYDMAEASIELRSNQTVTVEETASVSVDKAITAGSGTSSVVVTGTVTVNENLGAVAKVGNVKYTDIQEAIKAAAPNGTVEIIDDIVVEEWVMFAESLSISNGNIITKVINGLTIDGNDHTLTINSIESAGNGGRLFYDATNLNINDLTITYAEGVAGGIGLKSGTLDNVTLNGGAQGVFPGEGEITITGCTFKTGKAAIYSEVERNNLTVTGNTFDVGSENYVIYLRGATQFTDNTITSGKVNVVSGSPVVTGNDFGDNRFKVYNVATATIADNEINVLAFQDDTVPQSTFTDNDMSEEAQAALDAVQEKTPVIPTTINNIDDLKAFRDAVNSGYTYKNETVTLEADIDLANEEWTPIGGQTKYTKPDGNTATYNFEGRFDGGNHTIKNLKITMPGKNNVGFFGMTTEGSVKNLIIENADIEGRLNVGVVAGTPYTSVYANIKLAGHITVDGMSYVGGVGGKNAYANWTNIVINADSTSYVKADSIENDTYYRTYVGGVVGFMGEGGHKFTNITSNIDVTGTVCDVGGIVGIAHYNNVFENCQATGDVKIIGYKDEGDNLEMGGIAGVWHNTNGTKVTFINCKFTGSLESVNADNVIYTGEYANDGLVGKQYSASGTGELIIINFEWMTGTDAGFYIVSETEKAGVMRFLFAADINETIIESGIKYIKTADITESVDAAGVQGTESAFYGDVTGIPEGTEGAYLAVAYIETSSGTYWSDAVECSPNFTKLFTEYNPAQ